MKTDIEILREGKVIAGYDDHRLVVLNGQVYPFWGKNMRNPLDPRELLYSICREGSNDVNADTVYWSRKILNTVRESSKIRSNGYSIVTRHKSGSPRTILDTSTNNVIILGELCAKKELILPILSVQLADDDYRQESITEWRKRDFHRPARYDCEYSKNSWENDGSVQDYSWKRRTIETWSLYGEEFSIIQEEACTADAKPVVREYFRREDCED